MKIRKTLAVGIVAAAITTGATAPAQAETPAKSPVSTELSGNAIAGSYDTFHKLPLWISWPVALSLAAIWWIQGATHPGTG